MCSIQNEQGNFYLLIRRTEKYEKILRRKTRLTYKATTDRF